MLSKIKLFPLFLLLSTIAIAQKNKDIVLLKIDKEPVYKSEFERLFGKNINLKVNGESANIHDDIQLFVDYKLKLIEAKELQMDTIPSYVQEVARYRNQLVLPYLNDDSLIDSIVKEAYDRSLKEIRASHILVRLEKNATDTVAAYKKISAIRDSVIAGASFADLAKAKSEDPSARKNAGDLGFFSVFRMVYPFESAAFSTPVGEVSEIFRTQFGYHFLEVTDSRASLGEMEVAHIMIKDTTNTGAITINKIHSELMNNGDFEALCKKYSDDKRSSVNGGALGRFSIGSMPPPFGEISFSLTAENIYSKVFKTAYGWHIVKYINHYPVANFEDSKKELMQKAKKDSRSKTLSNPVVLRLKKEYTILINDDAKKDFENPNFVVKDSLNKWLIVIQQDTLTQKDFSKYTMNRRDKSALQNFNPYLDQEILEYYKVHLEETDEEFKNLFQEYKNGLLLFDLMKQKIWDAAQNDSIGLQNYYDENKSKYIKAETFNSVVVSTKNLDVIEALQKFISASDSIQVVENKIKDQKDVLLKSGNFEVGNSIFPNNVDLSIGKTTLYEQDGYSVIVKIYAKNESFQQEFKDIKGKVISDFQDSIQDKWLKELRAKHKIKIYKSRVKKLASQMEMYSE